MLKIACNINRSGKSESGGGAAPVAPTIPEVQQQSDAAVVPFDVHIVAIDGGQLRTVGYDQLRSCTVGSVFALLCKPASDGSPNHKDVFFLSQLLGVSTEFETPTGELMRTIWLRTLRRPGQSGPYGCLDRMDKLNAMITVNADDSEIFFLPAVDTFFMDPLASVRKFATQDPAGMDMTLYTIKESASGDPVESYLVYYGHFITANTLKIDHATSIIGDLIYSLIKYESGAAPSLTTGYANSLVLGLVSLAVFSKPESPDSSEASFLWSCLHKPGGSAAIDSQFLVYTFPDNPEAQGSGPSKSITSSLSVVGDTDLIFDFHECAYKASGVVG